MATIREIEDKDIGRTLAGIVIGKMLFIIYDDMHCARAVLYDRKRYVVGDVIEDEERYLRDHCASITKMQNVAIDTMWEKK